MGKPKAAALRHGHEHMIFDFTYEGERIRKTVTVEAVVALIRGDIDQDSNLVSGETQIKFEDFVNEVYIPYDATPRLPNAKSLDAEIDLVKALCVKLGKMWLHEITGKDAERCKEEWLDAEHAPSTIKRRWDALGRVLACGKAKGRIKEKRLHQAKGLTLADRSGIWLRLPEIAPLLAECERIHPDVAVLIEFLILTGARIGEAQLLLDGDIRDGKLWLPTEKQGCPPRDAMRPLDIKSLGPRFAALLPKLKPHPISGVYFRANERKRTPICESYANRILTQALPVIGRTDFTLHDCRGTFATHRAMVVDSFRQLQAELGHGDPKSIQSYLDRARQFDRRESVFYEPPKSRHPRVPGPKPKAIEPIIVDADGIIPPSPPTLLN